jgi:hypothetical protein
MRAHLPRLVLKLEADRGIRVGQLFPNATEAYGGISNSMPPPSTLKADQQRTSQDVGSVLRAVIENAAGIL